VLAVRGFGLLVEPDLTCLVAVSLTPGKEGVMIEIASNAALLLERNILAICSTS
jgi:hypothetical protein